MRMNELHDRCWSIIYATPLPVVATATFKKKHLMIDDGDSTYNKHIQVVVSCLVGLKVERTGRQAALCRSVCEIVITLLKV